jgi:glycine dehydrogenase subunit 2
MWPAVMITNPNTCGLFERDMKAIADAVHAAGGYVYCDGANFNAIVGRVRPGDLGVDAMHINLHKTFSTPHGGGGPGSGPVVLSEALAPYAPLPFITKMPMACFARRGRNGGRRRHPNRLAACAPSTARWACSPARWPTSSATALMA